MAVSGNREWCSPQQRSLGPDECKSASAAVSPPQSENAGDSGVGVPVATRRGASAGSRSCRLRSLGTEASFNGAWGVTVVGDKAFDGANVLFLTGSLQRLREHVVGIWLEPCDVGLGLHRDNAPCRHDRAEDAKAPGSI